MEAPTKPNSFAKVSETTRERAVYTYYDPKAAITDLFSLFTVLPETTLPPANHLPQASADTTLTALAQLATLRLKTDRSLVSLIDQSHQYILAEATPTLSLSPGPRPPGAETLWLGAMIIPKAYGLCQRALDLPFIPNNRSHVDAVVVSDLLLDDGFDSRCIAAKAPRSRFYASVPLRTDEGTCIGALSILDAKPRDGLSQEELRLFQDTADTIMSYLKTCKLRSDQTMGDRMIRGLTSFMTGEPVLDSIVDETRDGRPSSQNLVVDSIGSARQSEEPVHRTEKQINIEVMPPPGNRKEPQEIPTKVKPIKEQSDSQRPDLDTFEESHEATNRLRERMLPENAKDMFSRAANIIRNNCNYTGVVIFDSTISSYEGQIHATSGRNSRSYHHRRQSSNIDSGNSGRALCQILGFSSAASQSQSPTISESDLHSLLALHSTGSIYNISKSGEVSIDGPDSIATHKSSLNGSTESEKKNLERIAEVNAVRNISPDARSIAFFPLYDYRRARWFAGCFCYTVDANRILSPQLDLLYLRAFGNSMMTELSRLDAVTGERAKTTFVASISHELRSPLHGILGGVEVLQDTAIDDFQSSMVSSIEICGKTLLNTINHVMDFAKIGHFAETKSGGRSEAPSQKSKHRPTDMKSLTSVVDLSVVVEDTIEAVFLGESYRVTHPTSTDFDSSIPSRSSSQNRPETQEAERKALHVILDIPPRENWRFMTQPGSWKRILMNTFGNSLKYSETGFVHVSLRVAEGDGDSSLLVVKVADSGIGISPEFLQSQLYKPFSQENSFATGTGLGLSIVHQIVDAMGGSIAVKSEKHVGTEVTITLPFPPASTAPKSAPDSRAEMMAAAQVQLHQTKVSIFSPAISTEQTKVVGASTIEGNAKLTQSLVATLTQWLGMDATLVSQFPEAPVDFILCTEPSFEYLALLREKFMGLKMPIVLFLAIDTLEAATLRADARINNGVSVVEIITQPCGPYKLAEVLSRCLKRDRLTISNFNIVENPVTTIIGEMGDNVTTTATSITTAIKASADEEPLVNVVETQTTIVELPTNQVPTHSEDLTSGGLRILLVDDNPVNLRLLVAFMKKHKFAYVEARDGLEAFNTYKQADGHFDFVLMDLSMPIMDGTTSSREIRTYEREHGLKSTTILALTGLASATARIEALANGIDHYCTKPVKLKKLLPFLLGRTEDPNL